MCMCRTSSSLRPDYEATANATNPSVQVNIPAESGEMGILAQHVPSIEQLKPGLVEIIEEAGGSKQFFCT
jgi:F0F1-type ATP synthase epsilon subunit